MTRIGRSFVAALFALLAATPSAFAQAERSYSQAELDQMLAPVALYPDALLSQVLMAATYPIEVVEAARWTRAYPGLPGDEAVRAVETQDWDPSVKSLVAFPQVLQRMDENIDWTRALGDAFLAQEPQVMDTVQQLRWRAQAAGNLQSGEQIRVEQQGQIIVLQPASPQYVHVPYYDPLEVYGPWWWPAYQPVVWAPWPGYARPYRPRYSTGFWWGQPIGVSVSFFFGDFNWRERRVRVVNNFYHRSQPAAERGRWQHNPQRLRRVDARPVELRQGFAGAQSGQRIERRVERQAAQIQAPPAVQTQQQPAARTQQQPAARTQQQPAARTQQQPAARVQPQPAATAPAQPQVLPRVDRREVRERTRTERRETLQVQPQPRAVPEPRAQRQAPTAPQVAAPQQPARAAERQERREVRQEQRNERVRARAERP